MCICIDREKLQLLQKKVHLLLYNKKRCFRYSCKVLNSEFFQNYFCFDLPKSPRATADHDQNSSRKKAGKFKMKKNSKQKCWFLRFFSGVFLKFSFFCFCRCHYHGFAAVLEHSFPQGRGGPWASKHHPRQFILKDSACYHANAEAGRAERSWLHIPLQRRIHCSGKNGRAIRIRRIWR